MLSFRKKEKGQILTQASALSLILSGDATVTSTGSAEVNLLSKHRISERLNECHRFKKK